MKSIALPAALAFVAAVAVAQDKPSSRPVKSATAKQDAAAVKKLEACDALTYIPREEGLTDLSFSTKDALGVILDVKWKAPDLTTWSARVPDDLPPVEATRLRISLGQPATRGQIDVEVRRLVKNLVGEKDAPRYAKEDLSSPSPNEVKIVAFTEPVKAQVRDVLLTYDERGLQKSVKVTLPVGAVQEMKLTYVEAKGGKSVLKSTTMTKTGATGAESMTVENEYAEVGGFVLLKKTVLKNGAQVDTTMEFTDVKANSGLKDEDFKK